MRLRVYAFVNTPIDSSPKSVRRSAKEAYLARQSRAEQCNGKRSETKHSPAREKKKAKGKAKPRRAGKSKTKQGKKNQSRRGPGKEKWCHEYKLKQNKAR